MHIPLFSLELEDYEFSFDTFKFDLLDNQAENIIYPLPTEWEKYAEQFNCFNQITSGYYNVKYVF